VSIQSHRSRLTVRRPRIRDVLELSLLLLIALKLAGVIDWSWWWVLAPIWVGLIPAVLIGVGLLLIVGGLLAGRWVSQWYFARLLRRNPDWPRRPAP
jgi:hypothetical protein